MAGINRLGRGTAKPGTLRPQDPNRFKTEDFFSVDAEDDPEYIRRVIEVEQLANARQGALLARGAFDKGDSLYMKDELEKARNAELELRDAEMSRFAERRAQVTQAAPDDLHDALPVKRARVVSRPQVAVRACKKPVPNPTEVYQTDATAAARGDEATSVRDTEPARPDSSSARKLPRDDVRRRGIEGSTSAQHAKPSFAGHGVDGNGGLDLVYASSSDSDASQPSRSSESDAVIPGEARPGNAEPAGML